MLKVETLKKDARAIVGDLTQAVTISGTDYPCSVVSPSKSIVELLVDRSSGTYEFSITLLKDYAELLEIGEKVTYEGTQYRVVSPIGISVDGIMNILHLCNLTGARI